MARADTSKFQLYRDDEITVDRDGIPHYTGVMPHLMKEHKQRVLFAFAGLEGDGDTEEKERADLEKKQKRFAKRLIDALHGEAWTACQELLKEPEKLRVVKGYELVFAALTTIEKETIIRKTEAFERFFDQSYRKRGQPIDSYLRDKKQAWRELRDLDESSNMSEDLQAYFLLRGCNLSRDDRRAILLANRSSYNGAGIEQALRISFHDLHEKERFRSYEDRSPKKKGSGKGKRSFHANAAQESWDEQWEEDEGEEYADEAYEETEDQAWQDEGNQISDKGASEDDEIHEAYAAMDKMRKSYRDQRKKLKDMQKSRGFFRGEFTVEERAKAIEQEKSRSRCGACGRLGHWAGDSICPNKSSKPAKSKGKGKKGKKSDSANVVSDKPFPSFFTLTHGDVEEFADMVRTDDDDESRMPVDGGDDGLRRRVAAPRPSTTGATTPWEEVSSIGGGYGYNHTEEIVIGGVPYRPASSCLSAPTPGTGCSVADEVDAFRASGIKVHPVALAAEERVMPDLNTKGVQQLQELCVANEIAYSGLNKESLKERLTKFYAWQAVPKRGSAKDLVRMACLEDEPVELKPVPQIPKAQAPVLPKSSARARAAPVIEQTKQERQMRDSWSPQDPSMIGPSGRHTEDDMFMEGIPICHLRCEQCQAPMVGRTNRADGGKFYGCTNFSPKGCKFTITYSEGVTRFRTSLAEVHEQSFASGSAGSRRN